MENSRYVFLKMKLMDSTVAFESFQTVPLVALRDMDPYMQLEEGGRDFPVPGDTYFFIRLDLSRALIKNPSRTFFIQMTEDSMAGAGMQAGDILVVDRAMEVRHRSVVVAFLEGEFTVRRLLIGDEGLTLVAENPDIPPQPVDPDTVFSVWGVVRDVIHQQEFA